MKLYYSPGACSLAPHILLREAGITPDLVRVDLKSHKTPSDKDFYEINPKGYVPALILDNGETLTEGIAIDLYIAGKYPAANLAPKQDSFEYIRMIELLVFISTELHKGFFPLFANLEEKTQEIYKSRLEERFLTISEKLGNNDYLSGNKFTLPDAYLFTVLNWAVKLKVALPDNLLEYKKRVSERPKVQEAMSAEGLIRAK